MVSALANCRLVFVAPADGQTAVGDYAQDFITPVRELFGEVAESRTGAPGSDGIAEIAMHRRRVRELVAGGPPGRTLVHAELAAGGVAAFWACAGVKSVPVTATVHDPPQGVWWPGRTRFMASHRLMFHGLHYPLRPVSRRLEGWVNGERTLIALTETGRRSIAATYPRVATAHIPHIVRARPAVPPAQDRPRAVGFFGLVYRGKGFEHIARIRAALPADIGVRVAGRGTESLNATPGIDILGAVDGPAEDAFFSSVRAIVVPYGKRHFYAETYPASGVVAHALAYRTPVISTGYGALAELTEQQGALTVEHSPDEEVVSRRLADAIRSLIDDDARVAGLGDAADRARRDRSGQATAEAFAAVWETSLTSGSGDG